MRIYQSMMFLTLVGALSIFSCSKKEDKNPLEGTKWVDEDEEEYLYFGSSRMTVWYDDEDCYYRERYDYEVDGDMLIVDGEGVEFEIDGDELIIDDDITYYKDHFDEDDFNDDLCDDLAKPHPSGKSLFVERLKLKRAGGQ